MQIKLIFQLTIQVFVCLYQIYMISIVADLNQMTFLIMQRHQAVDIQSNRLGSTAADKLLVAVIYSIHNKSIKMGCVNPNASQKKALSHQPAPLGQPHPQPAKQPAAEAHPPPQNPQNQQNLYPPLHQQQQQAGQQHAVSSHFQNPAINKPPSLVQAAAPSEIIPNQKTQVLNQRDIKIEEKESSGLIHKEPVPPSSGVVQSYVSEHQKRVEELEVVQEHVHEYSPEVKEYPETLVEHHLKQTEQEDVVHSEGLANFSPPVRNINFHIQIS